MNFQFYYEKLINSDEYKKFKKENPKAFACSGFFVLDNETQKNQTHFDFWLPDEQKMYSFKLDNGVEFVNVENYDKRPFEPLSMNYAFDLKKVEEKIKKKMEEEKIKNEIKKSIFSLQKMEGKDFLVSTIFLSNLALLKVVISLPDEEIRQLEKKSFLDMFKIIKKKDKN